MEGLPLTSAKVFVSRLLPGDPWAAVFIGFGRDAARLRWEYRYVSMPGGRCGGSYAEWDLGEPDDEDLAQGEFGPRPWELDFVWMTILEVARNVSARVLTEEHEGPERAPGFYEISEVTEESGAFRVELGACDSPGPCQRALTKLREEARLPAVRDAIETALLAGEIPLEASILPEDEGGDGAPRARA